MTQPAADSARFGFLSGLIDYAGMFPPARLNLGSAIRLHLQYLASDNSWLLGRFIINANRLRQLEAHADKIAELDTPLGLTVLLGPGSQSRDELLQRVESSLKQITNSLKTHRPTVAVESMELTLPVADSDSAAVDGVRSICQTISKMIAAAGLEQMTLYVESAPGPDAQARDQNLIEALSKTDPDNCRFAFKLRCGGETPAATPSLDRVAAAITWCRQRRILMKCTAGLHHPLRHFDAELGAHRHGFLNVFGSAVLAHADALPDDKILQCLADEEAQSFTLDQKVFAWAGHEVATEAIAAARAAAITSFGSCSFNEPLDHLRSLGIL